VAPDLATPILVYCATGARSAFATKTLEELGYEHVANLEGGIVEWNFDPATGCPFWLDYAKKLG